MKMNKNLLPTELNSLLENEKIGFAVLTKREQSMQIITSNVAFGTILLFFGSFVMTHEYQNQASFGNGSFLDYFIDSFPNLFPALCLCLVGLGLILFVLVKNNNTGSYWVGTDTRLLKYRKGILKTYPWQQFSGKIEVDFHKGNIDFELLSGSMTNPKNGQRHFIPEKLSLIGIDDVVLVEKFSRTRMEVMREG